MSFEKVFKKYADVQVDSPRDRPEEPEYPFEGKINFQGLMIDVENLKGSTRSGTDPDGNEWSIEMQAHYGEIRKSEGADGDLLDVYVGDDEKSKWVYVVHQVNPSTYDNPGEFDEDKVMLGFSTANDAIAAYQAHYDKPDFFGGMSMIPMSKFKAWLNHPKTDGMPVQPPVQWKHRNMGPDEPPKTVRVASITGEEWNQLVDEGELAVANRILQTVRMSRRR